MKRTDAERMLRELIEDNSWDDGFAAALRALELWDAVCAVVPSAKAVATVRPEAVMDEDAWTLKGDWARIRAEVRSSEAQRILELFTYAARAYGEALHMEVKVVVGDPVDDDVGPLVWDFASNHADEDPKLKVLAPYQPLDSSLELEPDDDEDDNGGAG
jgi:hypothetical protein